MWEICFASYISVMASRDPRRVQDLLGYLVHIIKASLEFNGPAWANYDNTFRRQAAAMGKENWSSRNLSLFSICFTAKGKCRSKCDDCLGAGRSVSQCPFREEQEPGPSATWEPRRSNSEGGNLGQGAEGSMMGIVLI